MELFFNPFDSLLCILLGISFTVWFTLLLVFIIVPAILGVSFGIRRLYMKTLLKIFEVTFLHHDSLLEVRIITTDHGKVMSAEAEARDIINEILKRV